MNAPIRDAAGRLVAIGDLGYPDHRVLMEYDGEQHRTDDRQFGRDVDRLDDLAHLGWRVVRFTKAHRGAALRARFDRVRDELVARGWTPGAS
ncbi:hypothetical protein GCM10009819_11400 [Agromyces tropicus]|uniref:DUF559 domain-containing protein n=1 Tax=Agromyces tropicus TaxID=555371 RepID=A0ABN2U4X9_9MICO